MKRSMWIVAALTLAISGLAQAESIDFAVSPTPGAYDFQKSSTPVTGTYAAADIVGGQFHLQAGGAGYTDAGIILGLDGSMTLSQLTSVALATTPGSTPLAMNLWLDTNGNSSFFQFSADGHFTGLAGDAYWVSVDHGNSFTTTSKFWQMAGPVGGSNGYNTTPFALSDLQNATGPIDGETINGNTKVALWIGITGGQPNNTVDSATITSLILNNNGVDLVPAAAVPLPAAAWMGLSLLGALGVGTLLRSKLSRVYA